MISACRNLHLSSLSISRTALLAFGVSFLVLTGAGAATTAPVFDSHVHLWKGETSLELYEAKVRESGLEAPCIGAMWFGGPNQALAGQTALIRKANDDLLALA